jgi:hypothetical protein
MCTTVINVVLTEGGCLQVVFYVVISAFSVIHPSLQAPLTSSSSSSSSSTSSSPPSSSLSAGPASVPRGQDLHFPHLPARLGRSANLPNVGRGRLHRLRQQPPGELGGAMMMMMMMMMMVVVVVVRGYGRYDVMSLATWTICPSSKRCPCSPSMSTASR